MRRGFSVLLLLMSSCAMVLCQGRSTAFKDLSDRLGDDGRHGVLIGLLRTADELDPLISEMFGGGPHTVLAPNDVAFSKLPKGRLEAIRKDKTRLREFLFSHVFPNQVMLADMLVPVRGNPSQTLIRLKNLIGWNVTIICAERGGELHPTVNGGARISNGDILFSGGVIHELDAVLTPHPGGVN
jgi:uncharacterized surface protein with fasciclin (FAS1) repeats